MGEFDMEIPSGRVIFWGPELEDINQAVAIELLPGCYRGMAFSRGTEEVVDEMAPSGPDEYLIFLQKK
jgi:hypothetical protein